MTLFVSLGPSADGSSEMDVKIHWIYMNFLKDEIAYTFNTTIDPRDVESSQRTNTQAPRFKARVTASQINSESPLQMTSHVYYDVYKPRKWQIVAAEMDIIHIEGLGTFRPALEQSEIGNEVVRIECLTLLCNGTLFIMSTGNFISLEPRYIFVGTIVLKEIFGLVVIFFHGQKTISHKKGHHSNCS